jgi:tripartite-type tricarboxylate transporter receptor subunit TctC
VASRFANAQSYPSRPITVVVPFPAGGPTDTLARFLAERMRASLGQPIIIENVSGAAGSIGVGRVARATPDGYTLVIGIWSTHVVNAAIYSLQRRAERFRTGRSADKQFAVDRRKEDDAGK